MLAHYIAMEHILISCSGNLCAYHEPPTEYHSGAISPSGWKHYEVAMSDGRGCTHIFVDQASNHLMP